MQLRYMLGIRGNIGPEMTRKDSLASDIEARATDC